MNLTKELQKRLKNINSEILLAGVEEGDFLPNHSVYNPKKTRNFRVFLSRETQYFRVILFERKMPQDYEFCHLKGRFQNLNKVAELLKLWINEEAEVEKIANDFEELEKFEADTFQNPNPAIEARWTRVKNGIFHLGLGNLDWQNRYYKMLKVAKRKSAWQNYYPFTSHHWLRFSLDNAITHTWILDIYIIPSWEIDKGQYYVGFAEDKGEYFEDLDSAIDFYAKVLAENKPIKWKKG